MIGGDRLTKGTLDAGLLWTSLADSTKGGQVNRIFKLSGPAPTPALVPASLLLSHVSLSLSLDGVLPSVAAMDPLPAALWL